MKTSWIKDTGYYAAKKKFAASCNQIDKCELNRINNKISLFHPKF